MIIYIIVRSDLNMSKGKIASQCCHAVQELILSCHGGKGKKTLRKYIDSGSSKIILKVNGLNELNFIKEECNYKNIKYQTIIDIGKTEVLPDTMTVLGIGPIDKSIVPKCIRGLSLL